MLENNVTNWLVVKEEKMIEVARAAYELKSGKDCPCSVFESEEGETLIEYKEEGDKVVVLPMQQLFAEMSTVLSAYVGGKSIRKYKVLELDDYFMQHVFLVA